MRQQPRLIRLVVTCAAAMSLVAGFSISPTSPATAASIAMPTKTRVLNAEQKKAKANLAAAKKDLKKKQSSLKDALKLQAKTETALAKAQQTAKAAGILKFKASSTSAKAKSAAKALASAKKAYASARTLVAKRTDARDKAKANVVKLDAAYSWLINDISNLDCGVGTDVVNANGAVEHVWECGIVYMHEDGDTTHVKTTENKLVEVRNIGLQTPEMKKGSNKAQCGAKQAYENFKALMPEEVTVVQLRSITKGANTWGGGARPTRSVYKLNSETGLFDIDVQAEQMKAGWSFWWPSFVEWTHNAEYLDYLNTAKANKLGIWNPKLCGKVKASVPNMWVNSDAPTVVSDREPIFGEYVVLQNPTSAPIDISGWGLRDQSLNFFWDAKKKAWHQKDNHFPAKTIIPAGGHLTFYLDNPKKYTLSTTTEREYFKWGFGDGLPQLANTYVGSTKISGDGVYLLDPKGNVRNTFINPCGSSATGFAACTPPSWFTSLATPTQTQIIPVPIALNRVANTTYNPIVKLAGSSLVYVNDSGADVSITTNGKFVNGGVSSTQIDGLSPANTVLGYSTSASGTIYTNRRIPIADKTGTIRTTIYTRVASGYNTVPDISNLSQTDATTALTNAGFVSGTITQVAGGTAGLVVPTSQGLTGRQLLGATVNFSVHTGVQ